MYVADDLIHGEHPQAFSGRDIDLDPVIDVRSPTLWLFLSAFPSDVDSRIPVFVFRLMVM